MSEWTEYELIHNTDVESDISIIRVIWHIDRQVDGLRHRHSLHAFTVKTYPIF
jgi:hypothetical protein